MTEKDLDALESLAKAATPGPWDNVVGYRIYAGKKNVANAQEVFSCYAHEEISSKQAQANAAFIATANPAVVLELVTELRRQRKTMQRLAKALRVKNRALAIAQRECKYAQERAAKQEVKQ